MKTKTSTFKLILTMLMVSVFYTGKAQLPGFKRLASASFPGNAGLTKITTNKYLTISNYGTAQTLACWDSQFNLIWKQTFNISQFQMQEVTQTKDKNIVLMGIAASNLVVLKFDTIGNILYTKRYTNVSGNVSMSTIVPAVGNDTGFLLGGGNCVGANFLIKCDASGNVIWSKQFNNIAYGATKNAYSIVHSGNDYLVASDVMTGTVTATASDAAMMRVDAAGNMQWYKQLSMPADREIPRKLIRRSNNQFSLMCSTGYNNGTELVYFFDSTLTTVSYKKYTHTKNINLLSAEADNNAGLICVGIETTGSINKGLIFRTNSAGNFVWQMLTNGAPSTYNTQLGPILKLGANYIMSIGTVFSSVGMGVGVIDVNGSGLCSTSTVAITNNNTNPFTVTTPSVIVSNIPIIVTAATYTNLTFTFDPLVYCGITTGIDEVDADVSVSVYPNPSNGIIHYQVGSNLDGLHLKVSNAVGQTVMERKIETQESTLNLSDLPDGIYMLSFSNERGVYTKKIILQR